MTEYQCYVKVLVEVDADSMEEAKELAKSVVDEASKTAMLEYHSLEDDDIDFFED